MLQQVCEFLHNMFIKTPICGEFVIADGQISPSLDLLDGQRFWIVGSSLNDGIYTFHSSGIKDDDDSVVVGLLDESFSGTICALAVPPAVIALSAEIKSWEAANAGTLSTPFQSESFNGYSYSLKTGQNGSGYSWQDHFKPYLDRWRRICL